jgi:DNA polymerase-3 subunit alpha
MTDYADLRVHSYYSYRDGVCDIETLVASAVALGRTAMALTDHNHAAGFVEFQETADRLGLANPIFGAEMAVFWDEDSVLTETELGWARHSSGAEARRLASAKNNLARTYNLELLAINESGLQNLFKILTWAGTIGYDQSGAAEESRLREEILLENAQGIAVLSGGVSGKLSRLLALGRDAEAAKWASDLHSATNGQFYVELSAQAWAETDRNRLIPFAKKHNLPLLAVGDVYYIEPGQAKARDLLWAIADNVKLDAPNRRRPIGNTACPQPLEVLQKIFAAVPEALTNAANLADSCRVRLPKANLLLPEVALPPEFGGSAARYLRSLAQTNLEQRYDAPLPAKMVERLNYELGVIERAGFAPYILIVADIVRHAKEKAILCAPRGSSAGSLVCYALNITPLNPLDYDLLFERFLNEERLAPPDIDLDIADESRPHLLDYVVRKYGAQNVAHISTQNFEGAKSALRDAGKALGTDPMLVNRLVNSVPIEFQKTWSLTRCINEDKEFSSLYQKNPTARELIDHALLIEGTGRNSGTHAAGVVITPQPTAEYVPLLRTEGLAQPQKARAEGFLTPDTMTQWDMEGVEKRGLLKIDLLGLTAWTAIGNALKYIKSEQNIELDIWHLAHDDPKTFDMLCAGHTLGVFQLEKPGMKQFTLDFQPRSVANLAFLISAYRPGPMQFLPKIIAVRSGKEPLQTPIPDLEPLLAETYGAPVYQETMLKIAREVAGYTLGEADVLRKAIGKKDARLLAESEAKFLKGASAKGLSATEAQAVWQMFPPFAYYGFNQAHAIIYGYLSYITAYLKVHYPVEFFAALLSVAGGDTESITKVAKECRRLGIPLFAPDVNRSDSRLAIDRLPDGGRALRLGLESIKGLGPTGVEAIMNARREAGEFTGLAEFIKRVPGRAVNSRALTALIKVGAFPFGKRSQLEAVLAEAQKAAKAKTFSEPLLPDLAEYPLTTLHENEVALLGFELS